MESSLTLCCVYRSIGGSTSFTTTTTVHIAVVDTKLLTVVPNILCIYTFVCAL